MSKSSDTFESQLREKFANAENVRPETIANALGISGKNVRGFLRANFTRPIEQKGSTWLLSNEVTNATLDHFLAKRATNANVQETPNA